MSANQEEGNLEQNQDFNNLICKRIELLRPKLLDLTRRNPLLSTKFSDRSNTLVRIVDEVPELLLESIISSKMRIIPLPDLDAAPKDEKTKEFQNFLAEARLTDEIYLHALDNIDTDSDDAPNQLAKAERDLKDRLREKLNMPERQTKNNLSLQQHAKNNHVSPHFELPTTDEQHQDGRHSDDDIQTLLLPDVLNRKLNALLSKENTWKEETGISVLQASFGFLEWVDGNNSSPQFSPLLLIPVQLEKKHTRSGQGFWVSSDEGEIQENKVLAEKLRLDFNIILPEYDGKGLEAYFNEVSTQGPKNMIWRVRRWAAIGVFPSARLAMYHDLAQGNWDFASHQVISTLFGGSDTGHETLPFADEYDIDEPEIESKVPYLITDADSSQFSTIVDVSNEENIAVEGPPGTGKSQTIVNTIASCLARGKKVLFVAEKSAALEVVRSRLDAYGIGNFLLPLQANRSNKTQVIASIRDRVEMEPCGIPSELTHTTELLKETKEHLKNYIDIISSKFGDTELSIHNILGSCIGFSEVFRNLPDALRKYSIQNTHAITPEKLKNTLDRFEELEKSWINTTNYSDSWKNINLSNIDPFRAQELLELADTLSFEFSEAVKERKVLGDFGIPVSLNQEKLQYISGLIKTNTNSSVEDVAFASNLISSIITDNVKQYMQEVKHWQNASDTISQYISGKDYQQTKDNLLDITKLLDKHDISTLSIDDIDSAQTIYQNKINTMTYINELYEKSKKITTLFNSLNISGFVKILEIISSLPKQVLSIRDKKLDDPYIQSAFIKLPKDAQTLLEQKAVFEEEFFLSHLQSYEITVVHATALSSAGIFSFLSKEYRQAKKFYKLISKNKKFSNDYAALKLKELSEWQQEVKKFCENKVLEEVTGYQNEGLNTDFVPFLKTILFFQEIDDCFQGSDFADLRNFLKYAASEKIYSLPQIRGHNDIHHIHKVWLSQINVAINDTNELLKHCESDILKLTELREIFISPSDLDKEQLFKLYENVSKLLAKQESLRNNETIKRIMGPKFKAELTEDASLEKGFMLSTSLNKLDAPLREQLVLTAKNGQLDQLESSIQKIIARDIKALSTLKLLANITHSIPEEWLGDLSYSDFVSLMKTASKDKDGLIAYSRYVAALNNIPHEYKELANAIILSEKYNLTEIAHAIIKREMSKEIYNIYGSDLAAYNGTNLDGLRKKFQQCDRNLIELSRKALQSNLLNNANPPQGKGVGRKKDFTEFALIKNEISKKQRYIPIRSLTKRAGKALLELKPCWMMSPLAVAQYLPKGALEFDLVIIDEASQMTPENAVGALLRAKQTMVVGDTNQLPPTNFFNKMFDDEQADEDEKVTEESILEMANGSFTTLRRLRWHYRSRHSGLISFSNRHVYNDKLIVFPSAQEDAPDKGISYIKVDGFYSKGTNPEESKTIVDGIINFMRQNQNKSLGVVLLNQKQRDLVQEEMNYAIEQYSHVRRYIEKWQEQNDGLETFFIKNLENVQGDERDVIFIGTVYGPEKNGAPVMQRFGPINGVSGKRRLNVLFSRAKERIVTYSSMTSQDIKAEDESNPGVFMLKRWLEYSASNILDSGQYTYSEPDSDFEEHVIQQIQSIGCEAIPQVGVKGFSIDIGVKHPSWPHGFIMGVECDGATYHSSRAARDRDRLRQEVLEGLGWSLYRIWSTDWFEDSMRETNKLRESIKIRLEELTRNHENK